MRRCLKKEDGRIDWSGRRLRYNRMRGIPRLARGLHPRFRGQTCHVWGEPMSKEGGARLPSGASPGTLLSERNELFIFGVATQTVLCLRLVKSRGA